MAELRDKVRSLEALIAPRLTLPVEWGLTQKEAMLVCLMVGRDIVSKDYAIMAMYALNTGDEIPDQKIIDVFACKVRKKLKPFGVKIITHWGQGYSLEPSVREKLKPR